MAAVAMSGYWWAYRVRTSSTESLGFGSGSLTPLNSKVRESTWLSIRVRDLLEIELVRVRAVQVGTAQGFLSMLKRARHRQELGMRKETLKQDQPRQLWATSRLPSCAWLPPALPWRQPP